VGSSCNAIHFRVNLRINDRQKQASSDDSIRADGHVGAVGPLSVEPYTRNIASTAASRRPAAGGSVSSPVKRTVQPETNPLADVGPVRFPDGKTVGRWE